MADVIFGGADSNTSYTSGLIYSDGIQLPTGRAMADGQQKCLIFQLFAYVGGQSGAKAITIQLGNSVSNNFTVGQHSSNDGTGWIPSTNWLVQGGSTRFQINSSANGTLYYGHGGAGTTNIPSGSRAGTLGGAYRYAQGPVAPVAQGMTNIGSTSFTTNFGWSGDDGGTGVTGYCIQIADNPRFDNFRQVQTPTGNNNFTGLTPGTTYYFRAAAQTLVTDLCSTVGAWSNVVTAKTLSGGYIGNGGGWDSAQFWVGNGSSWQPATVYIGNGSAWTPAL